MFGEANRPVDFLPGLAFPARVLSTHHCAEFVSCPQQSSTSEIRVVLVTCACIPCLCGDNVVDEVQPSTHAFIRPM